MKKGITIYNDGFTIRMENRKILAIETKKGFHLEFYNILRGRRWKPIKTKRKKGCLVISAINFSKEALLLLSDAVIKYENNKFKNKDR